MTERTFTAPAKLNLFLHITGKRPDGYHNLQTLFQFIDYCDTLHFSHYDTPGDIHLESDLEGVNPKDNLIVKAAKALQHASGCSKGATIRLDKQLPMGGGLGGGSSDAATTLVALNQLWQTHLSEDRLAEIGLDLGADVPVFVRGRAALAEGVGEQLTPVSLDEPWYLLAIPDCHVETAALFADKHLTRNSKPIRIRAFLEGATQGHNDFEPVARRLFPDIESCFAVLNQVGEAKLTGTGACVFCRFDNRESALDAAQQVASLAPAGLKLRTQVAKGLNRSPLFQNP